MQNMEKKNSCWDSTCGRKSRNGKIRDGGFAPVVGSMPARFPESAKILNARLREGTILFSSA